MPKPDWERFGMQIMRNWPHGDVDGCELQDLAVENHIIAEVPGGYNPEMHNDEFGTSPDKGEPWFLANYTE